jgi:predicted enzyme related to lactoylglutathione lyase
LLFIDTTYLIHDRPIKLGNQRENTLFQWQTMLKNIESIIFFVDDIHAAARWYADLLGLSHDEVQYENPRYAFTQAPGVLIGFHPRDEKCPGGVGGTTSYWSVDNLEHAMKRMIDAGATLHRGPASTDLGARVCMLIDPFGNSIGLDQARAR